MDIDIRVLKLEPQFRDEEFHTPLKFGGGIVRSTASSTVRTESIDRSYPASDDGKLQSILGHEKCTPTVCTDGVSLRQRHS